MKDGFTLIEVLVTVVILSFIMTAIFGVLNVGNLAFNEDMALLDLHQQARQAMKGMTQELRQAKTSDITISNAGVRIDFKVPTNITISPVTYSSVIAYYLNNNQIIREYAGTPKVLANDIFSLSFCCWNGGTCGALCTGSNILQIQLTAQRTVRQRLLIFPLTGPLTEKMRLRNE